MRIGESVAVLLRVSGVDVLRHGLSPLRYVMVDGVGKGRIDFIDKTQRLGTVQVHVIHIDQRRRLRLSALVELTDNPAHKANQSAGLLKIRILLETRIKVFNGRVERIAVLNAGEAHGRGLRGQAGFVGLFQRVFECDGNLVHVMGSPRRNAFKEAGSQNVINFIRVQSDRLNIQGDAVRLMLQVLETGLQKGGAGFIRRFQIGKDKAHVTKLFFS